MMKIYDIALIDQKNKRIIKRRLQVYFFFMREVYYTEDSSTD